MYRFPRKLQQLRSTLRRSFPLSMAKKPPMNSEKTRLQSFFFGHPEWKANVGLHVAVWTQFGICTRLDMMIKTIQCSKLQVSLFPTVSQCFAENVTRKFFFVLDGTLTQNELGRSKSLVARSFCFAQEKNNFTENFSQWRRSSLNRIRICTLGIYRRDSFWSKVKVEQLHTMFTVSKLSHPVLKITTNVGPCLSLMEKVLYFTKHIFSPAVRHATRTISSVWMWPDMSQASMQYAHFLFDYNLLMLENVSFNDTQTIQVQFVHDLSIFVFDTAFYEILICSLIRHQLSIICSCFFCLF